jgi:hypothetical protein
MDQKKFQGNRVSFIISETIQKSRNPGFAEEPKTTWFTVNPLTSNCNYITALEVQLKVLWWPNQFQFLYRR